MSGNGLHLFQLSCRACPYRIHVFFRQYFPFYAPPLYFPASNACPAPSSSPSFHPPIASLLPRPSYFANRPPSLLPLIQRTASTLLLSFPIRPPPPPPPPLFLACSYLHYPSSPSPKLFPPPSDPIPKPHNKPQPLLAAKRLFFASGKEGMLKWKSGRLVKE